MLQPQVALSDQQPSQNYTISKGDLASVLNKFASETGILLSGDATLTAGKTSNGLNGDYSVDNGLNKILENSGLQVKQNDQGHYILKAVTIESSRSSATPPQSERADNLVLENLVITGTPQYRYDNRQVQTGSRFDKDITEVARSIDIIPEQLLLDSQAREMEDVYKLAPNVVNSDGYAGTREDYLIRGFRRPSDIYRNGVRIKTGRRIDPATVDNIQIIKGPVADIGQMMPGGLVNILTKKPQFDAQNTIATNFDEHGQRRVIFDSTGAINDSDHFAYRITGSAENSDSFRDFYQVERDFLSSSVSWFGDRGGYVNINYEYSKEERTMDRGFITSLDGNGNRSIVEVDRSVSYGGDFNLNEVKSQLFELDTVTPISNSTWDLETKLFYNTEEADDVRSEVRTVLGDGTLVRRVQGNDDRELNTFFARVQARGDVDFHFPVQVVSGFEYHKQDEEWINFAGSNQFGGTSTNPYSYTVTNDSATATRVHRDVSTQSYGIFGQIDMTPIDDVNITLGLRQEFYKAKFEKEVLSSGAITTAKTPRDSKFTKSIGVVWKLIPELSLYTSYADTFSAQNIYTGSETTAVLAPQQGKQYEIGTKWSTFDDRLLLTAAYFDIEQKNVVESINGEPELTGGVDSHGVELSLTANPIKGWNVRAALGLLEADIVSDTATNGNRPTNVPETTASIWSSYEFQDADHPLNGLGISTGVAHVANRYGDTNNSFELGNYTLVDAGIWYYLPPMAGTTVRFDLGVKNITDEKYYTASGGTYRISVGAPRTVFGGVRVDF
jgi:iron complex outermembrane receptor protein